jgi:4-hydroxybenzoate polyprenyltransferase
MAASADLLTPRRAQALRDYIRLTRLDRPIGIWLLLWPTLWALWIAANGEPSLRLALIFIAGTVLMRSAGCVINDLADRNLDLHVKRTRDRPLAARRLSPYRALTLFGVLVALALLLVLQLNAATIRLSLIAAALAVSYPFFKRFFPLPQFYLGLSFGWGVPMAFAAQLGHVPRAGWVLMLAAVLWAGVYDTFYAMVDRDDDVRMGVHSSAISFGDMDLLLIAVMQAMVLLALLLTGRSFGLGTAFQLSLAIGALLFGAQQWIARRRDRAACLRAFEHNNYFGAVVMIGLIIDYAGRGAAGTLP